MKIKITEQQLKECIEETVIDFINEKTKTKKMGSKNIYKDLFNKEAEGRREDQKKNGGLNFKAKPQWKSKEEKRRNKYKNWIDED